MTNKKTHISKSNVPLKVLVAPLNWGLGHATRCMPIINLLLKKGIEVIVASDGRALALLKKEYPNLKHIELPAYDIQYSGHTLGLVPMMLWQVPKILKAIRAEKKVVRQIIEAEKVDAIVSDNRYGCYSDTVPSIFVSHQLFLKMPTYLQFIEPIVAKTQMRFIRHFSACWIPDFPQKNKSLSGDLAHKESLSNKQFRFVGALSRMQKKLVNEGFEGDKGLISFFKKRYDLVAVLSGPEPQRTIFEDLLKKQMLQSDLQILLVRGVTEKQGFQSINDSIQVVNFLTAKELNQVLLAANVVIARSGYSTIMDLAALNKKAILIPTPGQTEQDYLANYFESKGIFYSTSQSNFELLKALKESENYSGFGFKSENNTLLKEAIEDLLKHI